MTRSEQHRGSGVSRMAGMASLLILLILLATAIAAQAQTFQVLHTFTGGDGVGPDAGLTMDRSGRLYGTVNGGTGNFGSVFRMAESGSGWVLNPLHQFVPPLANGDGPDVKAIFGPAGNLYSATAIGGDEQADCENDGQGCGVVFKLQPPATACVSFLCPWTETVLYQFTGQPDGDGPGSEVIFDAAGNLYGTTGSGGTGDCSNGGDPNYGCGTVYELSPSEGGWTEKVIYSFQGANDGYSPSGGLIFDATGNLYGVAEGGSGSKGVVYELSPSNGVWTETTVHAFQGSDGDGPWDTLVADPSGNLYGLTTTGGAHNSGTVFELTQPGTWNFQLLYSFSGSTTGTYPEGGLARDSAGNLYGTTGDGGTYDYGVAFKLTLSNGNWVETALHDFNLSDGIFLTGQLLIDSSGNIYGTAQEGGDASDCYPSLGCGTVWEISP